MVMRSHVPPEERSGNPASSGVNPFWCDGEKTSSSVSTPVGSTTYSMNGARGRTERRLSMLTGRTAAWLAAGSRTQDSMTMDAMRVSAAMA